MTTVREIFLLQRAGVKDLQGMLQFASLENESKNGDVDIQRGVRCRKRKRDISRIN